MLLGFPAPADASAALRAARNWPRALLRSEKLLPRSRPPWSLQNRLYSARPAAVDLPRCCQQGEPALRSAPAIAECSSLRQRVLEYDSLQTCQSQN